VTVKLLACPNPFTPHERVTRELVPGSTVRECLRAAGMDGGLRSIVSIDGVWVLQAEWERPIPRGAVVVAYRVVAGGKNGGIWASIGMIVAGIVITVATWGTGSGVGVALIAGGIVGLAASLLIQTPRVPSSLQFESGSPTYALDVVNRRRIGEPIPVLYGRARIVPDLVANPYTEYDSNDQYLYMVLCLGNGLFDIEEVRIAESPVNRLTNFTAEIIETGDTLGAFPDNVSTSSLVQGQLLRATNDVSRPGNTAVVFTASDQRITPVGNPTLFSGISVSDNITITNTGLNNATRNVTAVGPGGSYLAFASGIVDESPPGAGLAKGFVEITPAGDVTFTESTRTITDPTKKRFKRWKAGDVIVITNSHVNAGTFTLETVSGSGASATTVEPLGIEAGANPSFELASGGYIGPFPANAAGTVLEDIGLDLIFPKGLSDNGSDLTVGAEFQIRPIDDDGVATGGWTTLETVSITRDSLSPVRLSYTYPNPGGSDRWEARVRRTTSSEFDANMPDEVSWAGLRAYLPQVGTYDGVTVYALRVKATEQIPQDVARQINIIATRKLPVWNGTEWSEPTATRSPAWALADVLRSTEYGGGQADSRIDLAKLLTLDATWAARGDYFDGVFDQTITVWDALQRISRAGRATPIVSGGLMTFVRDQERTLRTILYTPQHIKKGSLGIEYSFRQADDPDGVELAWIDPRTWRPAHIEATISGDAPLRPATVDLFGVTNEEQAQREATYLARVDAYQRKVVRFTVEMDGHIPLVGDLIGLSHDVPSWGASGVLLSSRAVTSPWPPRTRYATSEPLTWTPDTAHYVGLRKPDGSLSGPYVATEVTGDPYAFEVADALDFVPRFDLSDGDRTAFLFGPGTTWCQDLVVTKVMPRSETEVELTCQPYDARIYAAGA
jgi:hypothetical protein